MSPFKVVNMASNGDEPIIDTDYYLYCEDASKLHVLYIFEESIGFTESFLETINLILRQDDLWAEYQSHINAPEEPDVHPIWTQPLWKMAAAFIAIHLERLSIPPGPGEFQGSIRAVYQLFHHNLETTFKTLIHIRDVDYDFLNMLGIVRP